MLKEIVIAIESYFRAHRFISKHRLWKWIIIPGILYMLLFMAGMYVFWQSSDAAVSYITGRLGIDSQTIMSARRRRAYSNRYHLSAIRASRTSPDPADRRGARPTRRLHSTPADPLA